MKNFKTNELGITLVGLVVIIIILLILAGISIASLTNSGLFEKARLAEQKYEEEQEKEQEILNDMLVQISGSNRQDIDNLKETVLNIVYPVGSIYMGTTNVNPSTFIGGTWESYGEGRTLVGAGTGTDTNNESVEFTANSTGGEYNHKLTIAEMPSHTHTFTNGGNALVLHSNSSVSTNQGFSNQANAGWWYDANKTESTIANSGQSNTHNNIQPYIVTYMWKRVK